MTKTKGLSSGSETSVGYEHSLDLPRRTRGARLVSAPLLPNYLGASVDRHGNLRWPPPPHRGAPLHKPPADLYFKFARLAEGTPVHLCRFAGLWGPLGKELGIPQNLDQWRRHAAVIRAILRFTADRLQGQPGRLEDWNTLCIWISLDPPPLDAKDVSTRMQMAVVCSAVNKWFNTAHGNAIMALEGEKLQIRAHGANLFGVLGIQTAYVVARADQQSVCAGCREPFRRARPLSRGSREYCDSCRKNKVPQRDAARDYRLREKS